MNYAGSKQLVEFDVPTFACVCVCILYNSEFIYNSIKFVVIVFDWMVFQFSISCNWENCSLMREKWHTTDVRINRILGRKTKIEKKSNEQRIWSNLSRLYRWSILFSYTKYSNFISFQFYSVIPFLVFKL